MCAKRRQEAYQPVTTKELNRRRDLLFDAFSAESERGVVLVAAAFIDHTLELLLRARFSSHAHKSKKVIDPLFEGFGPLATLSAKIKICYALDFLQKWVFEDLEIIRKLRNKLAHSTEAVQFGDPAVADLITKLKGADHAVTNMPVPPKSGAKQPPAREQTQSTGSDSLALRERVRFIMTVSYIGAMLQAKVIVQEEDLPAQIKLELMTTEKM